MVSDRAQACRSNHTYSLRLQVSATKTVHVLIEVWESVLVRLLSQLNRLTHHLKPVELIGHLLDLFLLSRLLHLHAWSIPGYMSVRPRFISVIQRYHLIYFSFAAACPVPLESCASCNGRVMVDCQCQRLR